MVVAVVSAVAAEAEADMAEAEGAAAAIVEIVATAEIAATAGNAPGNTFLKRAAAPRGRFLDCVFRAIAIGLPARAAAPRLSSACQRVATFSAVTGLKHPTRNFG